MPEGLPESALEKVARVLTAHGVEFLVIGGQAESLMGSPRVTYDVDLCYRRTKDNLDRLAKALRELKPTLRGAPSDLPFVIDVRTLALGNNFTFDTPIVPLDLLGFVEPIGTYEDLAVRAEGYAVGDLPVRTLSLDDLISIKR